MIPDINTILIFVLLAAVVVIAVFVYRLHTKGTPTNLLLPQTLLKAGGIADLVQESVIAAMHKFAEANPASLRDTYFDAQDFYADLGRLPMTFTNAVTLDGAIKRNGNAPPAAYLTQANGNVSKV